MIIMIAALGKGLYNTIITNIENNMMTFLSLVFTYLFLPPPPFPSSSTFGQSIKCISFFFIIQIKMLIFLITIGFSIV